jgi:hypothetical protein
LQRHWTVRAQVPLPGRREDADLVVLKKRGQVLCVVEIKSWMTWRATDPRCEKAAAQNARQKQALNACAAFLWLPQARFQPPVAVSRGQWVIHGDAHALRQAIESVARSCA